MNAKLDDQVIFSLSKAEALVLFEMLADIAEEPAILIRDAAERRTIWNVAAVLEKSLAEIFSPDYAQLLEQARKRLTSPSN